ncbi:Hint domain-containing protein [Pacificibacter maritimus]|uniref:Hint domain-containing protein n=1 Tax=Pacificibacter maritimus TaxID=762213 RepID=A0A3N4U931_9RHOB|nr:Hint domain-containing protein [Pacificibacter maritimus]RPE67243.1 Hint domain-containing protein [Pacificibacter maritimus]
MAISTHHAIFLGNFTDADSNDGSGSIGIENPGTYLGTFGSAGAPLSDQIIDVDYNDSNNDNSMSTDNISTADTLSYDAGSGPVTAQVDSLVVVDVTVTYSNGTTHAFSNAVMYQDTTGNLFLINSNFAGTDLNGTNNLPIQSINVTTITGSGYTGLTHNASQDFVCFVLGTAILTPLGEVPIEKLGVGDQVMTMDHGPRPIRWIGRRKVQVCNKLAPVRIKVGALGNGLPHTDLLVSQQHRMLLRSRIVRRMLDVDETLVPAKSLVDLPGICIDRFDREVTYLHLLLDAHEVLFANGAPSESLLLGPQALKIMGPAARDEILTIFPELAEQDALSGAARMIAPGRAQRKLFARHSKNAKPLYLEEI